MVQGHHVGALRVLEQRQVRDGVGRDQGKDPRRGATPCVGRERGGVDCVPIQVGEGDVVGIDHGSHQHLESGGGIDLHHPRGASDVDLIPDAVAMGRDSEMPRVGLADGGNGDAGLEDVAAVHDHPHVADLGIVGATRGVSVGEQASQQVNVRAVDYRHVPCPVRLHRTAHAGNHDGDAGHQAGR